MIEGQPTFRDVSRLLARGLAEGSFPGAVLLVGYKGQLVFEEAVGDATQRPVPRPMTLDTVFDLASLTKPIATTTALMLLVDTGKVGLDTPILTYFRACSLTDQNTSRVRQLLSHCTGLPAWRPYYRTIDPSLPQHHRKTRVYQEVHAEPLSALPGTTVCYSDLGFILLGELVETIVGTALDEFCRQAIFHPLGLTGMRFFDLARPRPLDLPFASTEDCPWRKHVLHGEVHDENAWIMGGVAGHAGLFATGREVWRFAEGLLGGLRGHPWLVSMATLRAFGQRQSMPKESTWALGWDTPSQGRSASGQYFSSGAIGHLGFTGTSLWIDPQKDVSVVFLTNRIHPSRQREGIRTFRPVIHDAVMQALSIL
ncbi:MAG: serine hydrolase domain-containing protein [Candidatus Entotheonellia bacterium]